MNTHPTEDPTEDPGEARARPEWLGCPMSTSVALEPHHSDQRTWRDATGSLGRDASMNSWLPHESHALANAIEQVGTRWSVVEKMVGNGRTQAMCRNRWQRMRANGGVAKRKGNLCRRCGMAKRGHTCRVTMPSFPSPEFRPIEGGWEHNNIPILTREEEEEEERETTMDVASTPPWHEIEIADGVSGWEVDLEIRLITRRQQPYYFCSAGGDAKPDDARQQPSPATTSAGTADDDLALRDVSPVPFFHASDEAPGDVPNGNDKHNADPHGAADDRCRYACKFPGCMQQYVSYDGVRKHARRKHLAWLLEQDRLAKAEAPYHERWRALAEKVYE